MPAAIPIAMVAASAVSGALAKKGSQSQTSSTTPTVAPQFQGLQDLLVKHATDRLTQGSALPAGYETGGIRNINNTFSQIAQSQGNNLTARGLANSPVAGMVDAKRDLARGGQIAQFQEQLPLVQRDMQNQDFSMANTLLNHGYGSTSQGTSTVSQGGGLGGSLSSIGSMLGFLMASGALGKQGGGSGQPTIPGFSAGPF